MIEYFAFSVFALGFERDVDGYFGRLLCGKPNLLATLRLKGHFRWLLDYLVCIELDSLLHRISLGRFFINNSLI